MPPLMAATIKYLSSHCSRVKRFPLIIEPPSRLLAPRLPVLLFTGSNTVNVDLTPGRQRLIRSPVRDDARHRPARGTGPMASLRYGLLNSGRVPGRAYLMEDCASGMEHEISTANINHTDFSRLTWTAWWTWHNFSPMARFYMLSEAKFYQ